MTQNADAPAADRGAAEASLTGENRSNSTAADGLFTCATRLPPWVIEAALDGASSDLCEAIADSCFLLESFAETLPEGEPRELLEQLIVDLECGARREIAAMVETLGEALERELAADAIIRIYRR